MRKTILLGFVALSGLASAQTDGGAMKAGQWEEISSLAMVSVGGDKPVEVISAQTNSEKNCYSEEQMREGAMLRDGAGPECEVTALKFEGGKVHMEGHCEFEQGASFEGSFDGTYTPTRMHLSGALKSAGMRMKTELRITLDARHLGDTCKPDKD